MSEVAPSCAIRYDSADYFGDILTGTYVYVK